MRERLEVDADEPEPGLAAGQDVAVDELAVGDDEQDARVMLACPRRRPRDSTW